MASLGTLDNRQLYLSRQTSLRRSKRKPSGFAGNVRSQLNEQLKCLESRLEVQVAMVTELQDFFRRLSEVEMEYSRSLEKLVKNTK